MKPLKGEQKKLETQMAKITSERMDLVVQWEDQKGRRFRGLERAAKSVTKKLKGTVRVTVKYAGNREPLFELLKTRVGGRLSDSIEKLRSIEEFSLTEFVQAIKQGRDTLSQKYNIPAIQADRIAQIGMENLMRIEELDLAPITEIELNVSSTDEEPRWQPLEQLSTGQKATAVLLLLLLEAKAPLIIDQPEDDLDNSFITGAVVPRMREEKCRRQFIFATHNANIPVLGDAELIVGLTASGEADSGRAKLAIDNMGSIDSLATQEMVEKVLEGGKEAFQTRRIKYGF